MNSIGLAYTNQQGYHFDYEITPNEAEYQTEQTLEEVKTFSENLSSLKKYFRQLYKIPLLLHSEELELAKAYKKSIKGKRSEDQDAAINARNKLILSNLRLVVSLAKRYASSRMELIELIQEGNLGLLKAAEKYDPEMGYRFSTYATWWIRQSILYSISEKSHIIRMPVSVSELLSKVRKTKENLPKLLGREATFREICQVLELQEQRLSTILALEELQEGIVHLDSTYIGDEGSESPLLESICSDEIPLEEELDRKIINEFLSDAIKHSLNERESFIVRMRYGLNESSQPQTLTELSKRLKVSLERIRQIEMKALGKLKTKIQMRFGDNRP